MFWNGARRIGFIVCLFCLLAGVGGQDIEQSSWEEDIEQLRQNLLTLEIKYKNAIQLLDSSNSTIQNLVKSVEDGKREIEGLKKYIEGLRQELLESKADYQTFSQDLKSWEATLERLEQNFQEVTKLYDKASKSFQDYKEAVDRSVRDLKTQRTIAVLIALGELAFIIFR